MSVLVLGGPNPPREIVLGQTPRGRWFGLPLDTWCGEPSGITVHRKLPVIVISERPVLYQEKLHRNHLTAPLLPRFTSPKEINPQPITNRLPVPAPRSFVSRIQPHPPPNRQFPIGYRSITHGGCRKRTHNDCCWGYKTC